MTQVNVVFTPGADMVKARLELARLPGVSKVEQVFPSCGGVEADPTLERMHVADVEGAHVAVFLATCAGSLDVEEAEVCPRRRLLLPVERA